MKGMLFFVDSQFSNQKNLSNKFKYWKMLQLLCIISIKTCRSVDVEGHSSKKWISSSILLRTKLYLCGNWKYIYQDNSDNIDRFTPVHNTTKYVLDTTMRKRTQIM
jgi:hypothetical protein